MNRYTVVCYRSDGDDYSMGCHMSSSPSDFDLLSAIDADGAGLRIAEKRFADRDPERDRATRSWDVYLLVDGLQEYDEEDGDHEAQAARQAAMVAADTHFQRMVAEDEGRKLAERERIAAAAALAKQQAAEAKEQYDLAEYARLKARFG